MVDELALNCDFGPDMGWAAGDGLNLSPPLVLQMNWVAIEFELRFQPILGSVLDPEGNHAFALEIG